MRHKSEQENTYTEEESIVHLLHNLLQFRVF